MFRKTDERNKIIKVICLKNDPNTYSRCHYFTIGKIYDLHIISGNYYLKNDKGKTKGLSDWMLNTERFKMVELEEYRQEQIHQLLK